jgi:purine-binding chemotaxis protein CheW
MSDTKVFDWQQVKQRVADAFASIDRIGQTEPADTKTILKKRAQALAAIPSADSDNDTDTIEILVFELAQECYAVETRYIREACPLDNLTALPCTPDFVKGVVNLRGEIVSVVDIKRFFGLPEKGITHLNKLIVLESDTMKFAILADHLIGVRPLPLSHLRAAQTVSSAINGRYVRGITTTGLALLDAGVLLSDEKMIIQ